MTETALTLRDLAEIPVTRLKGVGDKREEALAKLGITSVLDLLMFYPRRWVDRTYEARISDLVPGEETLVIGSVRRVDKRQTKNRRTMVNVSLGDGTGRLGITFFNQPWRASQLKEGMTLAVFGKADMYRNQLQMTNPIVDMVGDQTGRIVPIYPHSEKADIQTWELAGLVRNALERCASRGISDPIDVEMLAKAGLINRFDALRNIHLPESMEVRKQARDRLAFDEVFRVQAVLMMPVPPRNRIFMGRERGTR